MRKLVAADCHGGFDYENNLMENDCCVIANITQQMLVDIPDKLAKKSGDIDVVGRVDSACDINAVLADDGRRVACFPDDVGINGILRMIRTLCLSGLDARQ